jgi:hypothetical protein
MNKPLSFLALLIAAGATWAQPAGDGAQRARIGAERNQAEARLAAEEAACYKKFAVNDCLKEARSRTRERLAELRRQEIVLNDAERKRRAVERQLDLEERQQDKQRQDKSAERAEAAARQQEKKETLEQRAAERARGPASAPAAARAPTPRKPSLSRNTPRPDTAEALRLTQERQEEAKKRAERVARRQAEAARSGVKPLPVAP